jgi:hypothetical protein
MDLTLRICAAPSACNRKCQTEAFDHTGTLHQLMADNLHRWSHIEIKNREARIIDEFFFKKREGYNQLISISWLMHPLCNIWIPRLDPARVLATVRGRASSNFI